MPTLNPDKIYAIPEPIPMPALPADAEFSLELLCNNASEHLELSLARKTAFLQNLKRHAGPSATYTHKAILLESLAQIFVKLETMPNVSEKLAIAMKLHEDIGECTAGFHNRVNEILMSSQFHLSLPHVLYEYRMSIVNTCARSRTTDVHEYNRFLTLARNMGRGVKPLLIQDVFNGEISDGIIITMLDRAFEKRYQPFAILNHLKSQLKQNLQIYHGYQGHYETDGGYTLGQYRGFLDVIKTFLSLPPETQLNLEDYVISHLEDDEITLKVTDLNWGKITKTIIDETLNQHYLALSEAEHHLLEVILNPDTPLPEAVIPETFEALFHSGEALYDFLTYFENITLIKKLNLIALYFQTLSTQEKIHTLLLILPLFENKAELMTHLSAQLTQTSIKQHLKRDNLNGDNLLMTQIRENMSLNFSLLLLNVLSPGHQIDVLSQANHNGQNALMWALKYQHREAATLFNHLKTFSAAHRMTILTQTNSNRKNVLMMCIRFMPQMLPELLSLFEDFEPEAILSMLCPPMVDDEPVLDIFPFHEAEQNDEEEDDDDNAASIDDDEAETEDDSVLSDPPPFHSALYYAIKYAPANVGLILGMLEALEPEQKIDLIQNTLKIILDLIDEVELEPDVLLDALPALLALPQESARALKPYLGGVLEHGLGMLMASMEEEHDLNRIQAALDYVKDPEPALAPVLAQQGLFAAAEAQAPDGEPSAKRYKV